MSEERPPPRPAGTFTLSAGDKETEPIPYEASAAQVREAVEKAGINWWLLPAEWSAGG